MKKSLLLLAALVIAPLASCEPPAPPHTGPWDDPLANGETAIHDIKVGTVAADQEVMVRGTVTAKAGNAFYIQRGSEAVYVYGYQPAEDAYVPTIGHYVEVKGTTDAYNGLIQISDVTEVTSIQAEGQEITPVAVTNVASLTAADAGELVTFTNATFYEGSVSTTAASNVYVTIGGTRATVRTDRYSGETVNGAFAEIINEASYLDYVNFTGPLGWYNGAQFALVEGATISVSANPNPFDPSDTSAQASAKLELDAEYEYLKGGVVTDSISLLDFSFGYDVTYRVENVTHADQFPNAISVSGTTLTIESPTPDELPGGQFITAKLHGQLSYDGENYGEELSWNVRINSFNPNLVTIEEAVTAAQSDDFNSAEWKDNTILRGYVTELYTDLDGGLIQDGEHALMIYKLADLDFTFEVGQLIEIMGSLSLYNGAPQVGYISKVVEVEDTTIEQPVALNVTTGDEYKALDVYDIHRTITVTGLTYVSTEWDESDPYYHYNINFTLDGEAVTVRVNYHLGNAIMDAYKAFTDSLTAGDSVNFTGSVGYYNAFQLSPWTADAFVKA